MKKIKYYAAFLIVAIAVFALPVKAGTLNNSVDGVKYGSYSWTNDYYSKPNWANNFVKVNKTYTTFTNPCTNCQISFKLRDLAGSYYTGTLGLTMQSSEYEMPCTDGCTAPQNYSIGVMRVNFTLLNTTVNYTWRY